MCIRDRARGGHRSRARGSRRSGRRALLAGRASPIASASERFVTVLFGLISTRRGLLQLASAGHPTPFIVRETGVERPLLLTEPAIGVELGAALAPYPTETIELRRGDVVVLFTDGIAELRDEGGLFFEDEMSGLLAACHDMPTADVVARGEQ